MHASPQFLFQGPQLSLQPLAHRLSQDREVPLPGPSANVREAQEVERLRLAFATLAPILFRKAAKFDDPRLVGMQLKAKVRESVAQLRQEPLCFIPVLESCHEVIRKANEDDLSARLPLSPLPDPEVECVVEIDIRQQRANTPALNCPYLTLHPFALFQHAGLEPFLNQVHDAPIGYAVLDEFHQPPLIESVIGSYDTLPIIRISLRRSPLSVPGIRSKANRSPFLDRCIAKVNGFFCSSCRTAV